MEAAGIDSEIQASSTILGPHLSTDPWKYHQSPTAGDRGRSVALTTTSHSLVKQLHGWPVLCQTVQAMVDQCCVQLSNGWSLTVTNDQWSVLCPTVQ